MSSSRPAFIAIAFAAGIAAAFAGLQVQRMMASADADADAEATPPVPSASAVLTATSAVEVVGQRRPDFSLPDPDGKPLGPSDFDGKVLVVNFWATWCPPCLEEMPAFMRLQTRYAGQGVQFLGVAMDEVDNVRRYIAEMGLTYPTVHGQAEAMTIARAYGNEVGALPYTAVVARDGSITDVHMGELDESSAAALIEAALAR